MPIFDSVIIIRGTGPGSFLVGLVVSPHQVLEQDENTKKYQRNRSDQPLANPQADSPHDQVGETRQSEKDSQQDFGFHSGHT